MSYEFSEMLNRTVLYSCFAGEINDSLLVAYATEQRDKGYLATFKLELVDGREVSRHATTRRGLELLSSMVKQAEDEIRGRHVAMVAADDLTFGMFRMWELKREDLDYEVRVFRDFDEALNWLKTFLPL